MEFNFRLDLVIHPSDEVKAEDISIFLLQMGFVPFLQAFDQVKLKKTGASRAFSKVEELVLLLSEMGYGLFQLEQHKPEEKQSSAGIFRLRNGMGIRLSQRVEQNETLAEWINTMLHIVKHVYEEFSFRYEFEEGSGIMIQHPTIQRQFPEKSLEDWGEDKVVDIFWAFSAPWEGEEAEEGDIEFLQKVKNLPESVTYWVRGKLLIINWLGRSPQLGTVPEALARREHWLNANFDLPSGF